MPIKDRVLVETKRTVTVMLTANQWGLYGSWDDGEDGEFFGRELAAEALNAGMKEIIEKAERRGDVKWSEIEALLRKYSKFGASDSEGYHAVEDILDAVYGSSEL